MQTLTVRKAPLPWWVGGIVLGLVQVLAIAMVKPLGVSTQFVVADTKILQQVNPDYVASHPVIGKEKYQKFGYGWYLNIGLIAGALIAALITRRARLQALPVWWKANHGSKVKNRLLTAFLGGFFILLGARIAHGCTSGAFVSGWAQLSLSAIPISIGLFGAGMLTAWFVYPKTPEIQP